jgi:nodulation protein E
MGLVCALGNDVAESWAAMVAGKSGILPIRAVEVSGLKFRHGAELRGLDPAAHFEPGRVELLDRFVQLVLLAAREAVQDAGLATMNCGSGPNGNAWKLADKDGARAAVVTGTGAGGMATAETQLPRTRMHPFTVPRTMASASASQVAMEFGITGPAYTVCSACASASHAIGQAFWMVRQGLVDFALAGGSEAPFHLGTLKAWDALRVVSPDTCRPFSKDRRGLVLGEGAGVLVLESLERARARGAPIHAEMAGFGMSSDACHITQPSLEGPVLAMEAALRDAQVSVEAVGYVNAHGTGTTLNDVVESGAIRRVFGARPVAVSSTKSMHGHTLGAAGAIEAIATALALHNGVLPPTANFSERDPQCDIDVIANAARSLRCEYAMSNSLAFGGLNAVLVLRAPA